MPYYWSRVCNEGLLKISHFSNKDTEYWNQTLPNPPKELNVRYVAFFAFRNHRNANLCLVSAT